jgi:hypothetical protein
LSIFDLLFIALFLTSLAALLIAACFALRRQNARALRTLRNLGVAAAFYFGMVVVVSWFTPRRVIAMGDNRCFDDWCIGVERVQAVSDRTNAYTAHLRLSSTARRVAQREQNVVVYLTDEHSDRYDPIADPSATPISVLLLPGQSVETARTFELPAGVHPVGLVIDHQGGFPIGWFIIGDESWFHKPTMAAIR